MPPARVHSDSCLGPCGYQDILPIRKPQLPAGMGRVRGVMVACREREGGYCLTDVVISKSGLEYSEKNKGIFEIFVHFQSTVCFLTCSLGRVAEEPPHRCLFY